MRRPPLKPEIEALISRLEKEAREGHPYLFRLPDQFAARIGHDPKSETTADLKLSATHYPWEIFGRSFKHGEDTYQIINIGARQKEADQIDYDALIARETGGEVPGTVNLELSGRKRSAESLLHDLQIWAFFGSVREYFAHRSEGDLSTIETRVSDLLEATLASNEHFDCLLLLKNPPPGLREAEPDERLAETIRAHTVGVMRLSRLAEESRIYGIKRPLLPAVGLGHRTQPSLFNEAIRDFPELQARIQSGLDGKNVGVVEQNIRFETLPWAVQSQLYGEILRIGDEKRAVDQFVFRADPPMQRVLKRFHGRFFGEFSAHPETHTGKAEAIFTLDRHAPEFGALLDSLGSALTAPAP
jgi:hypothetical protein